MAEFAYNPHIVTSEGRGSFAVAGSVAVAELVDNGTLGGARVMGQDGVWHDMWSNWMYPEQECPQVNVLQATSEQPPRAYPQEMTLRCPKLALVKVDEGQPWPVCSAKWAVDSATIEQVRRHYDEMKCVMAGLRTRALQTKEIPPYVPTLSEIFRPKRAARRRAEQPPTPEPPTVYQNGERREIEIEVPVTLRVKYSQRHVPIIFPDRGQRKPGPVADRRNLYRVDTSEGRHRRWR
jgi:hypothetical protein